MNTPEIEDFTYDAPALMFEVSKKLWEESLINQLIEKAIDLSQKELMTFGDRIIDLADRCGVKYYGVTVPLDQDDNRQYRTYLFPAETYRESIFELENILHQPCNCSDPKISHKYCTVNSSHLYETTDAWFGEYEYDHIMVSTQNGDDCDAKGHVIFIELSNHGSD